MTADQLEREVLELPPDQRAHIAGRIIASLEDEAAADSEWLRVVERRGRELEAATRATARIERTSGSRRQPPRVASLHLHPTALDNFIAAWKAERAKERGGV